MRSAPLHHRGSTAVAFCLTVSVPESREVPPFHSKREVHLGGMGVVVLWPRVVAVWTWGGPTEEAPKWLVGAEQLGGAANAAVGVAAGGWAANRS